MTDQAVRVLIFLADRGIVDFLESILMSAGCGGLCARVVYFFSSRGRHTISLCDWSADVCSSDLIPLSPVSEPTLFQGSGKRGSGEPLAARMRPTSLEDFLGQEHLLGPGKALGGLIARGKVGRSIFWGPPAPGKPPFARSVATYTAPSFGPLKDEHIRMVIERAIAKSGNEKRETGKVLSVEAVDALVTYAQGDGRRVLNALEAVLDHVTHVSRVPFPVSREVVLSVLERPLPAYDKSGEQHFNLISALHKAVRGSDVEGSLYWLARMLAGGEDPLYLARRLVRIAAEDVGLADPRALTLALAAKDAYHFLGSPEGELALAEAVVYLATAPKSNRVYTAFAQAMEAAAAHPTEAVPLHIRNAPTKLMEELGYGAGYQYAHAFEHAYVPQEYLPDSLRGASWYQPTAAGYEKTIGERMEFWKQLKEKLLRDAGSGRREG